MMSIVYKKKIKAINLNFYPKIFLRKFQYIKFKWKT